MIKDITILLASSRCYVRQINITRNMFHSTTSAEMLRISMPTINNKNFHGATWKLDMRIRQQSAIPKN